MIKSLYQSFTGASLSNDEAYVPRNFFLLVLAQSVVKLGDMTASAKIVLPWLFASMGVPVFFTGLLVPVRESGALIPQLMLSPYVQQFDRRKGLYIAGSIIQGAAIAGIVWLSFFMELSPNLIGLSVIGLIAVFSLARSLCSITSKDILGRVIPKGSRGQVGGLGGSLAGLVAIVIGVLFVSDLLQQDSVIILLLSSVACWGLAAMMYAAVIEPMGQSKDQGTALIKEKWLLLRQDALLRQFIAARGLMVGVSLAAPFLIVAAKQQNADLGLEQLGVLIVLNGVAGFISSPFWGRWVDRNSQLSMVVTASIGAMICFVAALLITIGGFNAWWYIALFFILSVVHEGIRLSRKTYIVDIVDGDQRTDYVAVSNTCIGLILVFTGMLSAILSSLSDIAVFSLFALLSSLGAFVASRLKTAG